jgi:cytochrome c oxidase assembly protein subunit 15
VLLGLGGLVTTYRVGMAVPDWPTTFGYGMFSYPLDRMLENFGVTVEHGHRLAASTVGLFSILALVVAAGGAARRARALAFSGLALEALGLLAMLLGFLGAERGPSGPVLVFALLGAGALGLLTAIATPGSSAAFRSAAVAHLAIVAQGMLGGSRVLENEPALAFLHGACAQLVYGAIGAFVVTSSPSWSRATARLVPDESGVRFRAVLATCLVYTEIVAGAWLRHSGRTDALALHGILALGVIAALLVLAQALRRSAGASEIFLRVRRWVLVLLSAQVVLGALSAFAILVLSGGFDGGVSVTEAVAATTHVAVGALLFASTLAALLWSHRSLRAVERSSPLILERPA